MLRPAGEADVDAMREWRNQPVNREVSINHHEIAADEHRAWWSSGAGRPDAGRSWSSSTTDARSAWSPSSTSTSTVPSGPAPGASTSTTTTTSAEGTTMMAWMQVMKEATRYAFDDEDGPRLDVLNGEVLEGNDAVRAHEPAVPVHRGRARAARGRRPHDHRPPDLAASREPPPTQGPEGIHLMTDLAHGRGDAHHQGRRPLDRSRPRARS